MSYSSRTLLIPHLRSLSHLGRSSPACLFATRSGEWHGGLLCLPWGACLLNAPYGTSQRFGQVYYSTMSRLVSQWIDFSSRISPSGPEQSRPSSLFPSPSLSSCSFKRIACAKVGGC